MLSRRSPTRGLDAEHCNGSGPMTDSDAGYPETAQAPNSLTEAEAEAVRAQSRADEARAHAMRLRRQADDTSCEQRDTTDTADARDSGNTAVDDGAGEAEPPSASSPRRWQLRKVRRLERKVVRVAAMVLISTSLATSGYMVWQHLTLARERQRAAEFTAAARHGAEMLMSIDPDHAKENIQRLIDNATGELKSQLDVTATYMVKNAQDAKVTTKATVEDVAVESMTDNSAVVLVVAKSDTTNPDKSKRPPVSWRLSVDINRDGGQLKMSKLEFVQ
jgi:Mce-associated membrane protein